MHASAASGVSIHDRVQKRSGQTLRRVYGTDHLTGAAAEFRQKATLDAQFSAGLPQPLTLPHYSDHHGITGVRLDSAAGNLSLYLFYATPGDTEALIAELQGRLNATTWKAVVAQFKPELVSVLPYPLSLNGTSFVTASGTMAKEHIDLQLERTTIRVLGSVTWTGQ